MRKMHDCKSNARESRNVGKQGKFYTKYTIVQLALEDDLFRIYYHRCIRRCLLLLPLDEKVTPKSIFFCHHHQKVYIESSYSPKFQLLKCILS